MLKQFVAYLLLSTFTCCKQENNLGDQEKSAIVQATRATMENYYADIRKTGLTAEFAYLDSSKDFYWVPPRIPACAFVRQRCCHPATKCRQVYPHRQPV